MVFEEPKYVLSALWQMKNENVFTIVTKIAPESIKIFDRPKFANQTRDNKFSLLDNSFF